MGVYKRFDNVPEHRRLEQYTESYAGRDVWSVWAEHKIKQHQGDHYIKYIDRTERSWKPHMDERGRHHALARPSDIQTWAKTILERCNPISAYQIYYTKLESFYTWLQYHTDHPHVYHPVWMAAAEGGATERIWDAKMERREA